MKVVALIPARGGSKGLPRKNLYPLGGLPLIAWTIEAALKSKCISSVFVSTEDEEIAGVSSNFGATVIKRPVEYSEDNSGSEVVINHAIDYLSFMGVAYDLMALLQPTSPLRGAEDIDKAVSMIEVYGADCVISVYEPGHSPVKAYVQREDGSIEGLYNSSAPYQRRQDLPRAFQPNGAIYVFSKDGFKVNACIPRTNVFPYVMPVESSSDIDSLDDINEVKKILEVRNDKSRI